VDPAYPILALNFPFLSLCYPDTYIGVKFLSGLIDIQGYIPKVKIHMHCQVITAILGEQLKKDFVIWAI